MFLPEPNRPIRVLPDQIIYHLYPMDTSGMKTEFYTWNGKTHKRDVPATTIAYLNMVMSRREAEAYKKSKFNVDFGLDGYVVDKEKTRLHFHTSYEISEYGGRYVTNVIAWHEMVFDGTNASTARVVIGDERVLNTAMTFMLKHLSTAPYLSNHVPIIVARARSFGGAIVYRGSLDWDYPIWYIKADKPLWDKIIQGVYNELTLT